MMKIIFHIVLIIASLVVGDRQHVKYDFETETVKYVKFYTVDKNYPAVTMPKSHLSEMNYEDRKKLCIAVQEFASLQFLPNYEYYLFEAKPCEIGYEGKSVVLVTGYCPTIPEVSLRVGNSENAIVIMYVETLADLYKYEIELIKSISPAKLTNETRKELQKHFLYKLDNDERWKFCIAAKRRFKNLVLAFSIVKVELYHTVDSSNWPLDYTAIQCPTVPSTLYLRIGEANDKIKIMLVDLNDEIVV